jgi:hypothetical protein
MRLHLGLAVLVALAGCAPGDIRLSDQDLVARGTAVALRQTITRRVFEVNEGRPYYAYCLEGWKLRDGTAHVANVTGRRFTPRDFVVTSEGVPGGLLARVRHMGAVIPDEGVDRGTYVTVEFRLNCVDPHTRLASR